MDGWKHLEPAVHKQTCILFVVNGGLGDAVAITYPAVAARDAGHHVSVWAIGGNATQMQPIWRELGLTVVDREEAATADYDVIGCNCAESTLQSRCKGFAAIKHGAELRVPGRPHGTLVEEAMRLVPGLSIPQPPLGGLLGKDDRRDIILGPGVGRPKQNQLKRWGHWPDVLRYWPRPVTIIGDDNAREPWIAALAATDKGVTDRIGQTSIRDILSVLSRARVYVGPDNGLGHLAAACGVPCITMFTATEHRFRPHGDDRNILLDARNGDHIGDVVNALHRLVFRATKLPSPATADLLLSVIIGAHNEGEEVWQTIQDVAINAGCPTEIIVIDDGSTDSSCVGLAQRHAELKPPHPSTIKVKHLDGDRRGVAPARNAGAAMANGDVLMFLDAHMRVAPGTPALMADQAMTHDAVIVPGIAALYSTRSPNWMASYGLGKGYLNALWRRSKPRRRLEPTDAWVGPGWAVSRTAWGKIGPWPSQATNWGSTEIAMSVSANVAGIPVLASRDAVMWHRFRSSFPYRGVSTHDVWANAYIIARGILDDDDLVARMKAKHWRDQYEDLLSSPEMATLQSKWRKLRTMSGGEFLDRFLKLEPTPNQQAESSLIERIIALESEAAALRLSAGQDSYQVHAICSACDSYDRCTSACRMVDKLVSHLNDCPSFKWMRNKTISSET